MIFKHKKSFPFGKLFLSDHFKFEILYKPISACLPDGRSAAKAPAAMQDFIGFKRNPQQIPNTQTYKVNLPTSTTLQT